MKKFFTLLQKSLRRKWRKLCTVSMSSFVTVGHVKLISQEAGLLASPSSPSRETTNTLGPENLTG